MNGWCISLKLTFHVYYYVRTDERMVLNFKNKNFTYTTTSGQMNGWYISLKLTFHMYYYVRTDEQMVHNFKTNISRVLLREDR